MAYLLLTEYEIKSLTALIEARVVPALKSHDLSKAMFIATEDMSFFSH